MTWIRQHLRTANRRGVSMQRSRMGRIVFFSLLLPLLLDGFVQAGVPRTSATGVVAGQLTYRSDVKRRWRYERYYVDRKTGSLAEAVVALKSRSLRNYEAGTAKIHDMDQKDFRFVPETMAVRKGDTVRFSNSDRVVHNVSTIDLDPFNVNTPPNGDHTQRLIKAGGTSRPLRIGCVLHSTMRAWIYVFDHPFFVVTGSDGRFRLTDVPDGRYDLVVVHPAGNLQSGQPIEVKAGKVVDLSIELSPDNLKKRKKQ